MLRVFLFISLFLTASTGWAVTAEVCSSSTQGQPAVVSPTSCVITPLSYWAALLGWTPVATGKNPCGGYYFEPEFISAYPNPAPIDQMEMTVVSSGPSVYSINNASTLEGDVRLTQPGRQVTAEKVILTPNPTTGKVDQVDLQGDVHFQEAGKLIVGKTSHINLADKSVVVNDGAYHIARPATSGPVDAWGTLERAERDALGVIKLHRATYTTCTPTDPSWYVKAKDIQLNKETGRGTAKNAWLYAGKFPFFYTPYLNFPIDKRRYSGFLYPSVGYDTQSGEVLSIPYYFNLAPNYDDTLTITPMTRRGVLMNNLFRYLTKNSSGALQISGLPDDRQFQNFKQTTPQQFPPSNINTPFLNQLENDSNNRGAISFHDDTKFNANWSSVFDVNYVSDAYYFQDLGNDASTINTDQLLNQAQVSYQGENWQFSGLVQAYDTLHLINQTFILDQYQRLPQLDVAASYPDSAYGLDYEVNAEAVYFDHANDYFSDLPYPTGSRLHFNPQVSLPLHNNAAFFIPTLAVDMTDYVVANNGVINMNVSPPTIVPDSTPNLNTLRTLPMFDLDTGLYFERAVNIGGHGYNQTLEPRAYYLFVPTVNQNDIPVFDTTLPAFDYSELVRNNRFIGYDRVGDANQLSLGLTSRFLDNYDGADKLDASVGGIIYFHKHEVCLYPDCSDDPTINDSVSPIAGRLEYHLTKALSIIGNAAWDPNLSEINNDSVHAVYSPAPGKIFGVGYDFVRNGDVLNAANTGSSENNLYRLDLAISWPLATHWNVVGNWNYNISHGHPQTYFYGLEYDTCCWAMRFVASDTLQSEDALGNTTFRSTYYVQFLLKGLGAFGNASNSSLLTSSIPGYYDRFNS
jgi:LPS-assembly protein